MACFSAHLLFLGCRFYLVLQTFDNYGWSRLFHPSGFGFSIRFSRYRYYFSGDLLLCEVYPLLGLSGLEPPTSRLSGVRSNRLSYKPIEGLYEDSFFGFSENLFRQPPALPYRLQHSTIGRLGLNKFMQA